MVIHTRTYTAMRQYEISLTYNYMQADTYLHLAINKLYTCEHRNIGQ